MELNNFQEDNFEDGSPYNSDNESYWSDVICTKVPLPENFVAYIEKRELLREFDAVECNQDLIDNVMNNYIIVKRILSHLSWQDKLLCKQVCTTWHSAVLSLQKEQLSPADYMIDMHFSRIKNGVKFKHSGDFHIEPLVAFTFVNDVGIMACNKCMVLLPNTCDPPCDKEHSLIDFVQNKVTAPKDCMLTVRASFLSYRPLARSSTHEHAITNRSLCRRFPFMGGIFIPLIPDVKFHVINIKLATDIKKEFYDVLTSLSQDRIFKGVLVYVTEKFILQSFIEECAYLNYFKEIQPDVPYALGGCIVEDTYGQTDINQLVQSQCHYRMDEDSCFLSENFITVGMFTVPKNTSGSEDRNNFDMYSLVIESPDWAKAKIQKTINEFAKKVPRFEHSVALKLACVGRDKKHDQEEEYFRAEFPNTRIVGCFGNGELGLNHPTRPTEKSPTKKQCLSSRNLGILYSYSTVFVYIGWGKRSPVHGCPISKPSKNLKTNFTGERINVK